MMLIFNVLLLLATFIARSDGYKFMPQFQSKFQRCIACTVLISSMGSTLPSTSFADEASQNSAAHTTTAKILSFKSFTKKDLKLEEEVKLAEQEAEEDAKVLYDISFEYSHELSTLVNSIFSCLNRPPR